jgi:hypothetical protein
MFATGRGSMFSAKPVLSIKQRLHRMSASEATLSRRVLGYPVDQ